ncbi:MAG: hypothetical protein OXE47_06830, partial [Gammaproteobacteria bacterium]|nr:hypothetical protein [Gammaproteobacteria bacterium]
PRSAFLGLCEAGLVKGVPPGEYLKKSSKKLNKGYAVKAVSKLIENPKLKDNSPKELWELVISKAHDSQMDVVLALWEKQKIKR